MVKTCPICGKPQQNLHTHLSRTHKLDLSQRRKWLDHERKQKGNRLFVTSQKTPQQFTPNPRNRPAADTQCDRFQLHHPFTAIVAGMTGSGKTVWVQKLLEHASQVVRPPPQRIVWSYSQWQPAYDQMLNTVNAIEFVKGIPHGLDEDWFFDPKINNVIVIDDQMAEISNDKRILDLFTKGSHHRNLSVIFLSQNVYFQGKIMRTLSLNASYLVLFKNPRDKLQITTLGKQMYPGKTNHFVQKYETAVQRPYGYLFVDLKPSTSEDCRLRTNVLPNEEQLSQTGGQVKGLKGIANFFERQSYLQPPQLNIMQRLQEQMDAILSDPTLPPDVKIKEYEQLFSRFLTLQRQQLFPNSHITISNENPAPDTTTVVDEPTVMSTPQNISTTSVETVADSGIASASPQEPSLLRRLSSKVKIPFKTPQKTGEIFLTPLKSDSPSASTVVTTSSETPTQFPPTPLTSKGSETTKPPRWIRYQDADKYPGVYEPPRRSERIRAMIKSIPGWEKY